VAHGQSELIALSYFGAGSPLLCFGFSGSFVYGTGAQFASLGEETAQQLGAEVERLKRIVLLAASLLTAAAVSTAGLIAFVGLIVPRIFRLLFGPDHRLLLPPATLSEAISLMAADTLARILIAPTEIPVGVTTALGGGLFLFGFYGSKVGGPILDDLDYGVDLFLWREFGSQKPEFEHRSRGVCRASGIQRIGKEYSAQISERRPPSLPRESWF
jgi:hypothetical protein